VKEKKVERIRPNVSDTVTPGQLMALANKMRAGKTSDIGVVWHERLHDSRPGYRSMYASKSGDCGNGLIGAMEWLKHRIITND